MTVLAAIGDVSRFECAKKLVSYAGGADVHGKGITKQGRPDLRFVLVEAAHTSVRTHPY